MGRTKGSKNKPKKKGGIPLPADYVEVGKVVAVRSHGFHDITCSADPAKPMGCEGCSCEMYRRARATESELQTVKIELGWRDTLVNELKAENAQLLDKINVLEKDNQALAMKGGELALENRKLKYKGSKEHFNDIANGRDDDPPESKPKELSPYLKSRQGLKNGQE